MIGIRRSKRKDVEGLVILVDLGILSERIWNFYIKTKQWLPNNGVLPRFPDPADCHWRTSLHEPWLVPAYQSRPWTVREASQVPSVVEDIKKVLAEHAIPALDRYKTDEALRDHWLKSPLFASAEILHLGYLGALLGAIGPWSELPQVIRRLQALHFNKPAVDAMVAELQRILEDKRGKST